MMHPLALVLTIALVGCVPVPTKTQAYAGNALWFAASTYAFIAADNRRCDDVSTDADADADWDKATCDLGTNVETTTAEMVMALAIGGVVRTLINTYQGPVRPRTSRSR